MAKDWWCYIPNGERTALSQEDVTKFVEQVRRDPATFITLLDLPDIFMWALRKSGTRAGVWTYVRY